jgi:hypothetical protein
MIPASEKLDCATRSLADAVHHLRYHPGECARIAGAAVAAVMWSVDAWLSARGIGNFGGWGAMMNSFNLAAGAELWGEAAGLSSRASFLRHHPDFLPCDYCSMKPDAERWRLEMTALIRRVTAFVAERRMETKAIAGKRPR